MNNRRSIRHLLHFSAGGVLALAAFLADSIRGLLFQFGPGKWTIVVAGLVIILLGFLAQAGAVARFSETLCMVIVSVSVVLLFFEGVFRLIGFDFARQEEAWRKMPPFNREPIVPSGEVFFRRPAPEQWTGQVLKTALIRYGISPNPYGDEPPVTVRYNQMGFRNEDGYSDWEVAVAGDSFTEMGYLMYDQLFTTIVGKMLNLPVLNLVLLPNTLNRHPTDALCLGHAAHAPVGSMRRGGVQGGIDNGTNFLWGILTIRPGRGVLFQTLQPQSQKTLPPKLHREPGDSQSSSWLNLVERWFREITTNASVVGASVTSGSWLRHQAVP